MADAAAALRAAAQALQSITDTPRLDAELLMAHALETSREDLLLKLPDMNAPRDFRELLERRLAHEPVAHIVGAKEFWGLSFLVSSEVLIPRPDSELLIEEAVRLYANKPPARILDLGTGSGALLLAVLSEFPETTGIGIDASAPVLEIAHNNADRLSLTARAQFQMLDWLRSDWADDLPGPFDLILANPPYVSTDVTLSPEVAQYEPHDALFAGAEGLDDYRIILPALEKLLATGGHALLEIGYDQAESVTQLAESHGYFVRCQQDLGGNDRLLTLSRNAG